MALNPSTLQTRISQIISTIDDNDLATQGVSPDIDLISGLILGLRLAN